MKRTYHLLTGLLLSLLFWIQPLQAEVDIQLSRSSTSLDEPVRLVLRVEGENDASPDLSVLQQDFEILGRSSQQSISIINGQVAKTQGLTLTLLPRQAGRLTIPPIPVGEESSAPLTLDVVEAMYDREDSHATSAFIQLELNKSQAHLQEEVILTVRLYRADGVRVESLSEPQATLQDTVIRLLHEEQYPVEHEGQPYRVIEQRYAIYAYQTGRLQLGEVRFRGRTGSGGQPIFKLMRDPLNGSIQKVRIIRTTSEQVELDILPTPPAFTGKRWLPARDLQLINRMPLMQPTNESVQAMPLIEKQAAIKSDSYGNAFPTWLVWTLGVGWLATLIGWWLSRRRKSTSEPSEQQQEIEAQARDELPTILNALASAYQNIDQEAARTAWLSWGHYRWPGNPPGNLNRLTKRCSHNIALAVSALDRASYNPEAPNDWKEFNPRELLEPGNPGRTRQAQREIMIPTKPLKKAKGMEAFVCRPSADERTPLIFPPIHHSQR